MECENLGVPNPNSEGSAEDSRPHQGEINHDLESLRGRQYHEGVLVSVHDQRVVLPHNCNEAIKHGHLIILRLRTLVTLENDSSTFLDHLMQVGSSTYQSWLNRISFYN